MAASYFCHYSSALETGGRQEGAVKMKFTPAGPREAVVAICRGITVRSPSPILRVLNSALTREPRCEPVSVGGLVY